MRLKKLLYNFKIILLFILSVNVIQSYAQSVLQNISSKTIQLPKLIPQPRQVVWHKEEFDLKKVTAIVIKEDGLMLEAIKIQNFLKKKQISIPIVSKAPVKGNIIELVLDTINAEKYLKGGYGIQVTKTNIKITSASILGIYYGGITFFQLFEKNIIPTCKITDWPAFSWRGFMIDVGRNYQSISQIKQQIDVMAAYKLNVFHFHLTEDIAWRLFSNLYPNLTDSQFMERNIGKYYTINEIRDLINYCKERNINFIPEIDMPGHSAAFKRAMGVDMQSDSGMQICKNILTELCDNFEITDIHIGGDEVKFTNKFFLQEIVLLLKSIQKNVIAWDPGGIVPEGTMLQMWNGNSKVKKGYPALDSRHLYLNHFDPLEGVVTVFNHQITDVPKGDSQHLGAILCNWPDRKVDNEASLITMNAVYPTMLAFAERTWCGGGWPNYKSDIDLPGTERYNAFVEFEHRLLTHKSLYFQGKSFPYVKQSNIEWLLKGPFKNNGNTSMQFEPELKKVNSITKSSNDIKLYGGTIILRHFWDPMIGAHLKAQADSSTWYATRSIFSNVDTIVKCWIGFNNYSRSTATAPPPKGAWDNKNSKVWVNGQEIAPPEWKHAGQQINLEVSLIDEGYEYRAPTMLQLKKGENNILIKCPVKSFVGSDWQNPVKWMFTFVILDELNQ
jgi:hexosaminidase